MRRRLIRLARLALLPTLGACAYFNGIYNAREAERSGAKLLRSGKEAEAAAQYGVAAAKAESVLARYPKSRWRGDALLIAGRGAAYSNQCDRAIARLTEYLASRGLAPERRAEAQLPLGRCFVAKDRYLDALGLLDPLSRSADKQIAPQAAIWAARAAIALGRDDDALRYLASVDAGSAQWELALSSLGRRDYARAESLLTLRARRGDYRDDLLPALRELWRAGDRGKVRSVVLAFDGSRAPAATKARVHLALADLMIDSAADSLARLHLLRAQRLAADSALDAEAASRLTLLALHDLSSLADVQSQLARARPAARGTAIHRRLEDNLLLLEVLQGRTDYTGSSLFLAAEVARDSLRAPKLALTLLQRLLHSMPNSLVAPKALLAAAELLPDSADAYRDRVIREYPGSGFAMALTGRDPSALQSFRQTEELLRQFWTTAVDSVAKLRAERQASAAAPGAPTP